MTTTKTQADIDDLKRQWRSDPCWDIEDTEGFEGHREELTAYHQQCDAEWEAAYKAKLEVKAIVMGVPGNTSLASYVEILEYRIKVLSERLDRLENA